MTGYNGHTRSDMPRDRSDYSAHMSDVTPNEDIRSVMINRVVWGAVFAGVAIMFAVQLFLNLGGLGLGIATFAPAATGQWAVDLSWRTVLWWTMSGIIATYIGGYAAGRLSGDPVESTAAWHGLTMWAVSLLILAGFVLAGGGAVMGGMLNTVGMSNRSVASTSMNAPSVPSATTAQTTPVPNGMTTTNAPVSSRAAAMAALLTVVALILGAIAAWFGGSAGCIRPTVTVDRSVLH